MGRHSERGVRARAVGARCLGLALVQVPGLAGLRLLERPIRIWALARRRQTEAAIDARKEGEMFAFIAAFLARLSHDVVAFINLPAALLQRTLSAPLASTSSPPSAIMPRAKGSKVHDLDQDVQRRQMVHVKTKEECRLANETVDVWSIELPSKHAENILKSVLTLSATIKWHPIHTCTY